MGNNLVEGNTRQKISRDGTLNLLNNLDSYIFPEEGNIIRLTDEVIKKITSDTLFSYLNYNLIEKFQSPLKWNIFDRDIYLLFFLSKESKLRDQYHLYLA